jgi:ATP-dependent RNA helicase DHX37/DHR1
MIVLSTNVAETSLTIPNIRYVIDTGKSKEKIFDRKLAMSRF